MWYSSFIKQAMPYRWERSKESAESISKKGYESDLISLLGYISDYHYEFYDDLSDNSKLILDEYKEEIGLDNDNSYFYGDNDIYDLYINKLAELWMDENPDIVLLWLADTPDNAFEFSGMINKDDEYRKNLLRYSPPEEFDINPFLSDYSYGYAIKAPRDLTKPKYFSVISDDEWERNKNDISYW